MSHQASSSYQSSKHQHTISSKRKYLEIQHTILKMWFCPLDGTLLQIINSSSHDASSAHIFACPTCPYSQPITQPQIQRTYSSTTRKKVDDILGGDKAWENVDRTMAVCPQCSFGEAYFMQMQIRSADEPMSVFYKCVKCSHQWNDK